MDPSLTRESVLRATKVHSRDPDKIAICHMTYSPGEMKRIITYDQLYQLSEDLCKFFNDYLPKVSRINVGVCVQNKDALIPILLALWKGGRACVMLSPSSMTNWSYSNNHRETSFEFLVSCIVTDSYEEWVLEDVPCLTTFRLFSNIYRVYKTCELPCEQFASDNEICFGITTSGSTGRPKNVLVPWTTILLNAREISSLFVKYKDTVIGQLAPCTFDPFFVDLFMALLNGVTLFLILDNHCSENDMQFSTMEKADVTFQMKDIGKVLRAPLEATLVQITPSVYKSVRSNDTAWRAIENVKILLLGGEVIPVNLFNNARRPNDTCEIVDIYGLTEVSCWAMVTWLHSNGEATDRQKLLSGLGAVVNEEGELMITVDESRKCYIEGEGLPAAEIFTGDLVEIAEDTGIVKVIGRKDSVIKKFGHKISTYRSEQLLSYQEEIYNVAIVFDPETQILGWFVSIMGAGEDGPICPFQRPWQDILQNLNERERPDYIIRLASFPFSVNGKVVISDLRRRLKEISKRNTILLRNIWFETLLADWHYPLRTFLECGGTSFTAMVLINNLELSGLEVPKNLFTLLMKGINFTQFESLMMDGVESTKQFPTTKTNQTRGGKMVVQWKHFMNKCVDAPPQLVVIEETNYIVVGSHSSQISMLKCTDGSVRWTSYLQDRIISGVAVSFDQQLLFTGNFAGYLYCINSSTGATIWGFQAGGEIKSTPVVSSDGYYVYCGAYDKIIYLLCITHGQRVSQYGLPGSVLATPLLFNDLVIVATLDGTCSALTSDLSSLIWAINFSTPIFSSPCKMGMNFYVATVEGQISCYDGITGNEVWHREHDGNIFAGLTPVPSLNAITFGCHDKYAYLYDSDGRGVRREMPDAISAAADVDGTSVVGATTRGLVFRTDFISDATSYIQLPGDVFSSPKIVGDCVFVGCRDNYLYCIKMVPEDDPCERLVFSELD